MNQLIHGDCLEKMKDIPDNSVDLIVTDPPYLINYKTNYRKDKTHDFCTPINNDNNVKFIVDYIKECHRIMKDNTAMYIFTSPDTVEIFKFELLKFFKVKNMIIWVKNNWTAGDLKGQFGKQYEIIFLVNKGRKEFNGKRLTDVWFFDRVTGNKQIHQNQKPIELIERCIEKHTKEYDTVFDGCSGSGTTAIACINTNRNYIFIEKDETYFNIMKDRIDKERKK